MTSNPSPDVPGEWVSDKLDLDEMLKDVTPYSGGDEYAAPEVFESDEEHQEFLAWYRAEREKELA